MNFDHLIPIITLGLILSIGFIKVIFTYKALKERIRFVDDYYEQYTKFIESIEARQPDQVIYTWLIQNVDKIQSLLGNIGVLAAYIPAFAPYIYKNYDIILNVLPRIARNTAHQDDIMMVSETLIRYSGVLIEQEAENKRKMKNPLIWFREGISFILLLPLYLLDLLGISLAKVIQQTTAHPIMKLISGIVSLITLVGGIFSILKGWDETMKILSSVFTR